jgi:hypothetical protein
MDKYYWIDIFKRMEKHEIDTWDYQWTYSIFNNNGICINPAKNLVTNIGFGSDATHTVNDDPAHNNQRRFEITELVHPNKIKIDNVYINKINKVGLGITVLWYYKTLIIKFLKNNMFLYSLFIKCKKLLKRHGE